MGSRLGIEKIAAKKTGLSLEDYHSRITNNEKWCTRCRCWHSVAEFGIDLNRTDGRSAQCRRSKRVIQRALNFGRGRRGWLTETRDGDKLQARRRVNYLVEQGIIPHSDDIPCVDCADMVFSTNYRHEYDHVHGYNGANQLYVEPVCVKCHRNREEARRGEAT